MKFLYTLTILIAACTMTTTADAKDFAYVGDEQVIAAAYEDTFVYLARDYSLGYLDIVLANPGIDPWLPGKGTKITLPTRHILPNAPQEGIIINLAEMRLYAFLHKNEPPISFPIGVGREGLETPLGTTQIIRKTKGPTWTPTQRMRDEDPSLPQSIGPGSQNPLGTHALYLGWPQYLIHGTNRPFGIGRRISSGCIRMYPEDIERVFSLVPKGTQVTIIEQPLKAAWIDDTLYLEVHPTMEQSTQFEDKGIIDDAPLSDKDKEWIKQVAGDKAGALNWDAINNLVKARSGRPMPILTKATKSQQTESKDSPDVKSTKKALKTPSTPPKTHAYN